MTERDHILSRMSCSELQDYTLQGGTLPSLLHVKLQQYTTEQTRMQRDLKDLPQDELAYAQAHRRTKNGRPLAKEIA